MTAVIWTDVVQMTLYVAGAIASFIVILGKIPGGWDHVMAVAGEAHKLTVFDFRFEPTMDFFSRTYSFWAGIAGVTSITDSSSAISSSALLVSRSIGVRLSLRGPMLRFACLAGVLWALACALVVFLDSS